MNSLKNFGSRTINLLFTSLFSFSLVAALTFSLNFRHSPFVIFLLILALTLFLALAFINRITCFVFLGTFAASIIGFTVYAVYKKFFWRIITHIKDLAIWMYDYIDGGVSLNDRNSLYITVLLCILFSIFGFLFSYKKFNFYILFVGGFAVFVSQWMLEYFVSYTAFYLYVLLILTYYFLFIYQNKTRNRQHHYMNSALFMVWMVPVSLFILLVSLTIPSKDKPIEWKWMDNKINEVVNYFNRIDYGGEVFDYFSISSSGFGGGDDRLGGKVRLDKTLVLKVNSPRNNVYLRGSTKDTYTGFAWTNSERNFTSLPQSYQQLSFDINEMMAGMLLLTRNDRQLRKYFVDQVEKPEKVDITFENIRSNSLFVPLKIHNVDFKNISSLNNFKSDSNTILVSDNKLGKDFSYSVNLFNVKYDDKEFKTILQSSRKGFYEEVLNSLAINGSNPEILIPTDTGFRTAFISQNQLRSLAEHSRGIYSRYLQLPETLPKRVRDLAASLTSFSNNEYDKVKAIEQYLCNTFPYTLTPPKTPRKKDFVDHFLFDLKQGYCTYYASAMVVMVRSIGIPARYVEGYILPPSPTEGTTYDVTNEQAHAWVEVYFEGFGWMPFEPTAPFTAAFYRSSSSTATFSGSFAEDPEYLQYMYMMQQYGNSHVRMDPDELGDNIVGGMGYSKISKLILILCIVGFFLLSMFAIILINFFRTRVLLHKMKKMHPKCSVLFAYKFYLRLLSCHNLVIRNGETPLQFGDRVDRYVVFRPIRFKSLTDIFVKARYSTLSITDNEKRMFMEFYKDAIAKTKFELGKFKFFFFRYFMGKF